MELARCRIVLVRPLIAGNIGATARLMGNFGLHDLVLVAPEADPLDRQARKQSTRSEHLLHECRIVPDLGDALADCLLVVGTTARTDGVFRQQGLGLPEDVLPHLLAVLPHGPAALVFGSEPTGLTNDEVTRCHHVLTIPTHDTHPALNLSHSVAICLYELRRLWLKQNTPPALPGLAPHEYQERMFDHLRTALTEVRFLFSERADTLFHAIRHLLGRAGLTPVEVNLLHGLARQLRWYVAHSTLNADSPTRQDPPPPPAPPSP